MTDDMRKEINDIELIIGKIMQIGVLLAAAVMLVGMAMLLISGASGYPAGVHPHTITAIASGVVHFKAYAWLMTGIFLLILTPVLRVVVSIYAFIKEQDRLYTWITTIVLVILVVAMIIGYIG
ncbi:DUF1634 domain-containing protein [Lacticaseibacillus jixiensis]|uniref:DUF1634 domain-containing protein n=1 Tax=Lacticaseibacillus jixiensis TaxID=3231926 RepID=UPI0036F3CF1D